MTLAHSDYYTLAAQNHSTGESLALSFPLPALNKQRWKNETPEMQARLILWDLSREFRHNVENLPAFTVTHDEAHPDGTRSRGVEFRAYGEKISLGWNYLPN